PSARWYVLRVRLGSFADATETLFTRRRTPRPSAGAPPRGGPRSRRRRLLTLDQEHSSGGAVPVQDLQRSTDQLVGSGLDSPQIERLDDDDASAKQRVVYWISRFLRPLRFYGEVVDSDDLHAVIDAPLRRARVQGGEVARERCAGIRPACAVPCLKQEPLCSVRDLRPIEPVT